MQQLPPYADCIQTDVERELKETNLQLTTMHEQLNELKEKLSASMTKVGELEEELTASQLALNESDIPVKDRCDSVLVPYVYLRVASFSGVTVL